MSESEPSEPPTEDVNTMLYVFGEEVVIISWNSEDTAVQAAVYTDRLSAMNQLEQDLRESDPEGLEEALLLLQKTECVPWLKTNASPTVIPDGLVARFGDLLVFGTTVCETAGFDDPAEALEELIREHECFYAYGGGEGDDFAILLLFVSPQSTPKGLLLRDQDAANRVLDTDLVGIVGPQTRSALQDAFQRLPATGEETLELNQSLSVVLLVGRTGEVHAEKTREQPRVLQ